MNIGIVSNPKQSHEWPQIKAYLEPAAKLGGVPVLEQHEEVWTVSDGVDLLAACTARILPEEKIGEVVLVGGHDHRRWLQQLDQMLGCWFRMEGMREMRAYGRRGWKRELSALGWREIGKKDNVIAYRKAL